LLRSGFVAGVGALFGLGLLYGAVNGSGDGCQGERLQGWGDLVGKVEKKKPLPVLYWARGLV